jgi:hypothetical protein
VIFIGSSRTHTTINPAVVDSTTGLSTYNAGMEGAVISEFKMVFDGYLLHHPIPKMLVLTIDQNSLKETGEMFDQTKYFPFLNKNRFIENEFGSNDGHVTLLKYFPFLEVIYMDDYVKNNAVKGLMSKTEIKKGAFQYKGFLSNGTKCIDTAARKKNLLANADISLQKETLSDLDAIIKTCKQKDIRLIITYAPQYGNLNENVSKTFQSFINVMDSTTKSNNIKFYRDDQLPLNKNPCFFANAGHTNTQGAMAYSKILGQRLKYLLSPDHDSFNTY